MTRLPGVLVPRAMLRDPAGFGGRALGDALVGDLVVQAGRAVGLVPSDAAPRRVILPGLCDPHVHLDKCHSIDRMQDVGGDLAAAIAAQARDKANWSAADLRRRAGRGLDEARGNGVTVLRSHVDWGAVAEPEAVPLAWDVLGELSGPGLIVQRAALTDVPQLADPGFAAALGARLARDGGVLGAFVFDQPDRAAGLRAAFRTADRFGLALDFHVDEGLDAALDGLERIADLALAMRFQGPILCGHACSLANCDAKATARIADKLAKADIAVAVLPQTNLYLQGRGPGTPDRRGLTRLHELRAAGVRTVLGSDNVRDAFCPIGRHDPLHSLALAVLAAHLDPPFGRHLPLITTDARRALGLEPLTVDGADLGDLLVFDASSVSELLAAPPRPRRLADLTESAS